MFPVALSLVALSLLNAEAALGQATGTFPATPLANKRFTYPTGIPEKVDTDVGLIRGTQYGVNRCGPNTEGQDSKCQTAFLNSLDDFCLWGPPEPGLDVGSHEGEMVAWCTKPGRGTRLIPQGALTGVQFIKTPDYVQVVGFIDQTKINVLAGDFGGEMDPHGADLRGNPLGGLFFSNAWSGDKNKYEQGVEWHNFLGSNTFCLKVCDPSKPNAKHFCEHIYDRIGCAYNAPNNAQNNVFESCDGENQDFPGTYTVDGQVMTYTQPAESLGPISTMPYTARIPASSNCVPFQSSALFANLPVATGVAPSSSSSSGASSTPSNTSTGTSATPTGVRPTNTPASTTGTGTASGASATPSSAAMSIVIPGISLMGVIFSALFLA